jgi:hypothetical protein
MVQAETGVDAPVPGDVPDHIVVGEHPGRGGPDRGVQRDPVVHHLPDGRRVPGAAEEVKVERGVQLVRAQVERESVRGVGEPYLADEGPRLLVAVGHPAPGPVHLVHLIPVRVGVRERGVVRVEVVQQGILHQQRGGVDPDPVGPAVEPEPQHVLELLVHPRVLPVEVGLPGGEQVQVPLAVRAIRILGAGPGRAAEDGLPIVRG